VGHFHVEQQKASVLTAADLCHIFPAHFQPRAAHDDTPTKVHMKTARIMSLAVLIVGSGLVLYVSRAQQPGIKRTDVLRHDLGVSS
jgi:hypothetical protein